MARPTIFGSGKDLIIDLTLSDSDSDDVAASTSLAAHSKINGSSNGRPNPLHPSTSHAHPPRSIQHSGGPPAKRVKLDNTAQNATDTAYTLLYTYAEAGAKQAAKEEPRLNEPVIKDKVSFCLPLVAVDTV